MNDWSTKIESPQTGIKDTGTHLRHASMPACAQYEKPTKSIAGDWARNSHGQIVAAWDETRAIKGMEHEYFCHCTCGGGVTLRRGKIKRPHFAYKTNRRDGCTGGTTCLETELHYNAKWLLCDIFPKINFWRVCHIGHRITKDQYTGPEWTATVEKKIPGTDRRIADVLLQNSSTGMSVALEVHNTNAVSKQKREECELAGVPIIEIDVDMITPNCFDLDNEQNEYQCEDCSVCIREKQKRMERYKVHRAREAREREVDREVERERNAIIAVEEDERMKREAQLKSERMKREAVAEDDRMKRENERIKREAVKKDERIKQETEDKKRKAEWSRFYHKQRVRADAARKYGAIADAKREEDRVNE